MIDDVLVEAESVAIIVMGVSGAGKTSVGRQIATRMRGAYLEADDYHSPHNIAKMSAGAPLTDDDRRPWIDALSRAISETPADIAVASCSALSRNIRTQLRDGIGGGVLFVFLTAPYDVIEKRLDARKGHFMTSKLLRSQFAALEVPQNAISISVDQSFDAVCEQTLREIRMRLSR